ncbi:MAG: hypothetical protein ACKVZJ_13190 [Phycisphaerales bacterium]
MLSTHLPEGHTTMDATFEILARAAAEYWVMTMITAMVVFGSLFSALKNMVKYTAREKTRREIAAYIAEGSLSAEQGERLMKAGKSTHDSCS